MENIDNALIELIKKASCILPADVLNQIKKAYKKEKKGSPAFSALNDIIKNAEIAEKNSTPLCQDTGTNYFIVKYPKKMDTDFIREKINQNIIKACSLNYLRPNSVDPITGKNTGNNTGKGHPSIDFIQSNSDILEISLMLKGGGCENMGVQYSLPDNKLNAGRDIQGVKTCIIDAVYRAQGFGCAPGIIGVCIGGDRADSIKHAKKQLFRKLGSYNGEKHIADMEKELYKKANKLEIGPMGFGGKTTVLGIFIDYLNRIPASFFVSISYMCWACRRYTLKLNKNGEFTIE
jgi:fumarate hydratase class I